MVIEDNLIMFKNPTIYSKPIAVFKKGRLARIIKCEGKWCKAKSNQYKGLIETKLNDTSFFDISVNQNEHYSTSSLNGNTTLLFVIEGQIEVENFEVKENQLVQLSTSTLNVLAQKDSRFLLFSAPSIKEPIARSGPFVMNTKEEIYQAIMDYQAGNF